MKENGGFGRGRGGQDNEKVCDVKQNWKAFKKRLEYSPICAKQAFFAAGMSREQVAKILWHKFWKICLSVFRDWEIHSRASHEESCESFWVNLRLELSLMNQSPNWVVKILKTYKFWNFSNSFSWLWDWLSRELRELLSKLTTWVLRLEWPVRMSHQNRAT